MVFKTGDKSELRSFKKDQDFEEEKALKKRIQAMCSLLGKVYGIDKLVIKAGKMEAVSLLKSRKAEDRVLGLQRIVYGDPTLDKLPAREEIPAILGDIEDRVAELLARKALEENIEKKVSARLHK